MGSMDDAKDKVKGFMKKVNNHFSSSSSGKFKGQGRVLGSSSCSAGPANPAIARPPPQSPPAKQQNPSQTRSNSSRSLGQPQPLSPTRLPRRPTPDPAPRSETGEAFDPFGSLISSGKRAQNGTSVSVFECPVCGRGFNSEYEVSAHVESCLSDRLENVAGQDGQLAVEVPEMDSRDDLANRIGVFLSGEPSDASVDVVIRLLRNISREPGNDKFRRIRMSNSKIKEAIGAVVGGMELLECLRFSLQQEGDEMWATMEAPADDRMVLIKEAVALLESRHADKSSSAVEPSKESVPIDRKKIDRQVRVFFSVPENVAAKIELPDSFYNLTAEELKREAELRRKKMAESQLLIPKSYKEKQAKLARKRYKATVIRIQFPDGVVLQGVFLPWEPTITLYEFVSSSLKEPSLEFELLQPAMPKRRVIPRFTSAEGQTPTLDEESLVPSALIKFRPIETDSVVFTGLRNELLEVCEPLAASTALVPP